MDNTDYESMGFDQFLSKDGVGSAGASDPSYLLSASQFTQTSATSANNVQGGVMKSQNGNLSIDLQNGNIVLSDGSQERFRLGTLDDGSLGVVMRDNNGNIIQQISGTTNFIQSIAGTLLLDLTAEQLLVFNQGVAQILLGKLTNGF